jgi:type IV pilus assembly protein PilC
MPLLPSHFSARSEFYSQINQLTGAGIGVVQAVTQLAARPPSRSYAVPLARVHAAITQGATFSEALTAQGDWLPEFDLALLRAGEVSGRLETCFNLLAAYYAQRAALAREMLGAMAYPAFLFHFAIFIFPFPDLFVTGNWVVYLTKTCGVLVPIYLVLALGAYATQARHSELWRSVMENFASMIPLLGAGLRSMALGRLAAGLEALISAGVSIVEAWDLAANACGSSRIKQVVSTWRARLLSGSTPSELVNTTALFPQLFASQYATGEISGKLDECLRRLHHYYAEEGSRKLRAFTQWTPKLVYLMVAGLIAWKVVSFYLGYFQQLGKVMDM